MVDRHNMPIGNMDDGMVSHASYADLLGERDALATENASLRGNCTRMGQDAKHQARALKRAIRERDALAAQVETAKRDAEAIAQAVVDTYAQKTVDPDLWPPTAHRAKERMNGAMEVIENLRTSRQEAK